MSNEQLLYIELNERKDELELLIFIARKYQTKLKFCLDEINRMQKELDAINDLIAKSRS